MPETPYITHPGASLAPPIVDRYRPPHGDITWMEDDPRAVSTAGPALTVSVDFRVSRARGREQIVVARLRDVRGYLPSRLEEYADPDANLAVSATVTVSSAGLAENVVLVIPYIAFPRDSGDITEVEIAVHEPSGPLAAIDYLQVELPVSYDRSPDLLTVVTHTLVTLARTSGKISREEVRIIRTLLVDNFDLEDLGDQALRGILKVAARVEHSPQTLAEVIDHSVPPQAHARLVNLLYAAARVDGPCAPREQRFIEELLAACGIHDHQRYGPARLKPFFEELELEPGSDFASTKRAYKQLVRDYHPDRVHNLAKGFRDFALDKTKRLNEAYGELRDALEHPETPVHVELDEG